MEPARRSDFSIGSSRGDEALIKTTGQLQTEDQSLVTSAATKLCRQIALCLSLSAAALLFAGCTVSKETPEQRATAAKTLFDQTTKNLHLPSAEAEGAERLRLQNEAADAYRQLLKKYPDQEKWAAPALRSLGNIHAAQTNVSEAVQLYSSVEKKYPRQEWEVLMSWKSAGDLLWDAGRRDEARPFFQKIVARFETTNAPQVVQTIVRGSKTRLGQAGPAPAP